MGLPWVSRDAHRTLERENEHLRSVNATLIDQLTRVRRAEAGLPEAATEKKPVDPMPEDVEEAIALYESPVIRRELTTEAWRLYERHGRDWDAVRNVFDRWEESADGEHG